MKRKKILVGVLVSVSALTVLAATLAFALLRASLPPLDGSLSLTGLHQPVSIERDAIGVVTVTAADRADLAFGTGFAHGQDRFFQMDLARRLAAGELSALFGAVALQHDRAIRRFRFRRLAGTQLSQATREERALLEAYAQGVNAGLASLRSRPWEYWLLGLRPEPWRVEDTMLATDAMWWDLQSEAFAREELRQQLNEHLPGPLCAGGWKCAMNFFYPARTVWDAPDDGASAPAAVAEADDLPGPDVLDLRTGGGIAPVTPAARPAVGSNGWAVAGRYTASGAALVASDMHLTQRVPPTWYHMRLRLIGPQGVPGLDLNGVTLPGAPLLVAGSNGRVAWAFTNSYGTWFSVRHVHCVAIGSAALRTAEGDLPLERARERIRVRGAADEPLEILSSAGSILLRAEPAQHSCWLGAWLAQQPEATNLHLMGLEQARSVEDALALAPSIGIPQQNLVVGDADGHIGWSIAGRIPLDTGPLRATGIIHWSGPREHPRLLDPPIGRIWTANARVSDDPRVEALIGGDLAGLGAEYDLGARARQIRDGLLAIDHPATPEDMLRIQLDDRALFLGRWHALLLQLLDAQALGERPERARAMQLLRTWGARAATDSSGYRIVRAFHDRTQLDLWRSLLGALRLPPDLQAPVPSQFEHALWLMVSRQPRWLLDARYASWRQFLLAEFDATVAQLHSRCGELARCTWGERNTVAIRHPLSGALPGLARLLDMPVLELPGDQDMPRVQVDTDGASERFAVSPGHESNGYLHLPGGQSGHPLSPYYRAGFMAWARGQPLPLLPGPAEHSLQLRPERN